MEASFMARVDKRMCESDCKLYKEELSKTFSKEVGFRKYLHGVSDAWSRLLLLGLRCIV